MGPPLDACPESHGGGESSKKCATVVTQVRLAGNYAGDDMRSGCLWLLGVPIPIIILLWLISGHA
jgi:hypothetical protein